MFERRFAAILPQAFTADGTTVGSFSIADTSLFKVKQLVVISAVGQPNLELEVKKILSATLMVVGPVSKNHNDFVDISAYTVGASAQIFASEQLRPVVVGDVYQRAVYEEEPIVANRTILVDEHGRKIASDNPLPTTAVINLGDITIGSVAQGAPNTLANAWPVKVTDGTNVAGISDVSGQKALKVDVVQSVNLSSTLITPVYVNDSGFIAKTVSYFYTVDDDIDRIETVIGSKKKIEQYNYTGGKLTSSTVIIEDV